VIDGELKLIIKREGPSSIRFSIEQAEKNSAYIHHLTDLFFTWGYSSYLVPKIVKKSNFSTRTLLDIITD
jgi:hypothetical protein